jgi:hypothetical protein
MEVQEAQESPLGCILASPLIRPLKKKTIHRGGDETEPQIPKWTWNEEIRCTDGSLKLSCDVIRL